MNHEQHHQSAITLHLSASSEKHFICPTDSKRYIVFSIQVHRTSELRVQKRAPLSLALVLDRSGSMQGDKLQTAKKAALAVLDHLTPRDTVSLVVFDNQIDLIQSQAAVTPELKSRVREALHPLQARASTALHEGWLTGCKNLTDEASNTEAHRLSRCFLLTDGIANVGVTDPEQIASEAAGVREHAAISTSTFGIGSDYNELLLGPIAVAGGGQFHHLHKPEEIINTFVGELGELLSVAARQVRLEIETAHNVTLDLISPYWMRSHADNPLRRVISIGDLQSDSQVPVVVRCNFPESAGQEPQVVRARLIGRIDSAESATDWREIRFSYTSQSACENETSDPDVMHWASQHEADRARREAVALNNRGDVAGAAQHLGKSAAHVRRLFASSPTARDEASDLDQLAQQMAAAPLPPSATKEIYYQQQRRSSSKTDHRRSRFPEKPSDEDKNSPR